MPADGICDLTRRLWG